VRASTSTPSPYAIQPRILFGRGHDRWRTLTAIASLALASLVAPDSSDAGAPGPDDHEEPGIAEFVDGKPPLEKRSGPIIRNVPAPAPSPPGEKRPTKVRSAAFTAPLDPSARLLAGGDASESWTLYVELDSGHRIAQRFLISNAGPGDHNAVAVGHLIEPGRPPYRYQNGRRRARWTLSDDHLFLDIAASHLDLHRPTGELRITKKDIEIRLFFDFPKSGLASRVPNDRLPNNYYVDVLAVAAQTRGTIQAPWMSEPLETQGRTWLAHTWTRFDEAKLVDRRIEIYGYEDGTSFYGLQIRRGNDFDRAWVLAESNSTNMIESIINIPASWTEIRSRENDGPASPYPVPSRFEFSGGSLSGQISLGKEWLRFDPLAVIPQPFRWFIRRVSKPQEVWADARIGVTLSTALETPSLPDASETESDSNSKRETEEETAKRSVTGVASITFMNPDEGR
jgi:hypothetical protein